MWTCYQRYGMRRACCHTQKREMINVTRYPTQARISAECISFARSMVVSTVSMMGTMMIRNAKNLILHATCIAICQFKFRCQNANCRTLRILQIVVRVLGQLILVTCTGAAASIPPESATIVFCLRFSIKNLCSLSRFHLGDGAQSAKDFIGPWMTISPRMLRKKDLAYLHVLNWPNHFFGVNRHRIMGRTEPTSSSFRTPELTICSGPSHMRCHRMVQPSGRIP